MNILGLGYIGFAVKDLAAWRTLLADIIGLAPAEDTGLPSRRVYFRMDDRPWRVAIEESDADGLACAGFEVTDGAALEAAVRALRAGGVDVQTGAGEERGVAAVARFRDPAGNPLELFHGARRVAAPFQPPLGIAGFKTGALGMGHLLLNVPDAAASVDFYTKMLGMRLTDFTRFGDKGAYFLRCNARHHTVGLLDVAPKPGVNHFLIEMETLDDVGRAYDRAMAAEIPIIMSLGRHLNDRTVSFYGKTPSGFGFEVGWGGLLIEDEAKWVATEFQSGKVWGHHGAMRDALNAAQRTQAAQP